jgi:hypothetical protein
VVVGDGDGGNDTKELIATRLSTHLANESSADEASALQANHKPQMPSVKRCPLPFYGL